MTTGVGVVSMIFLTAVKPFMRGISTSRVITSGLRAGIFWRASSPSLAVPMTVTLGSVWRRSVRTFCISRESSTMSTLMFFVHIALMCVYLEVVRVGWVFQLGFGGCGLDLEAFGVFCGVDVGFGDDFHEVEEDD